MNPHELSPDCARFRAELAGLVYDELAPDPRAALEEHVSGCAACGEELATLRDTRRMLARWETPTTSEDPRALARAIVQRAAGAPAAAPAPRRARLVRLSAVLSAVAAAVLFLLALLGTQLNAGDGRLELSFGLPGARPAPGRAPGGGLDEALVRTIANDVVDDAFVQRGAAFRQDQEELLQRYSLMSREEMQQELLRLSRAVDLALAEKERAYEQRLEALGREAVRADLEQRDRIQDLYQILPASNSDR